MPKNLSRGRMPWISRKMGLRGSSIAKIRFLFLERISFHSHPKLYWFPYKIHLPIGKPACILPELYNWAQGLGGWREMGEVGSRRFECEIPNMNKFIIRGSEKLCLLCLQGISSDMDEVVPNKRTRKWKYTTEQCACIKISFEGLPSTKGGYRLM